MVKKINQTIAGIYATEVVKIIREATKKKFEASKKLAVSSEEFKEYKKLFAERRRINNQLSRLEEKIATTYRGVKLKSYGDNPELTTQYTTPNYQLTEVRSRVLLANHVKGVMPEKVVDYVVNQIVNDKP
jgi:hypothetical protein